MVVNQRKTFQRKILSENFSAKTYFERIVKGKREKCKIEKSSV